MSTPTAGQLASVAWFGALDAGADDPACWDAAASAVIGRAEAELECLREKLGRVRDLAEKWAAMAPPDRSLAVDLSTPSRAAVSSDCGRDILSVLDGQGSPDRESEKEVRDGSGT